MKVRYYAGARAAAGVLEDEIDEVQSVAEALHVVTERHSALIRVLPACSLLLNGVAVHDHGIKLAKDAELDVLPPFAGG